MLYELLTGEKPFGGSIEAIAFKICYEDPRPPSEISKLPVSPALDAIVADRARQGSPEARFQNARAFNRALRQALDPQLNLKARSGRRDGDQPRRGDDCRRRRRRLGRHDRCRRSSVSSRASVGPMAKVIVQQGGGEDRGTPSELYALTADSIADVEERRKFMAALTGAPSPSTTGSGMSSTQPISVRKGRAGQTAPPQARSMSSMTRPLAPLDQEFVDQTTSRLAVYLGPVARIVARKAAQKAGTQQEFVHLVAGHLGAQERGAFLRELGYDDAAPS